MAKKVAKKAEASGGAAKAKSTAKNCKRELIVERVPPTEGERERRIDALLKEVVTKMLAMGSSIDFPCVADAKFKKGSHYNHYVIFVKVRDSLGDSWGECDIYFRTIYYGGQFSSGEIGLVGIEVRGGDRTQSYESKIVRVENSSSFRVPRIVLEYVPLNIDKAVQRIFDNVRMDIAESNQKLARERRRLVSIEKVKKAAAASILTVDNDGNFVIKFRELHKFNPDSPKEVEKLNGLIEGIFGSDAVLGCVVDQKQEIKDLSKSVPVSIAYYENKLAGRYD